MGMLTEDEMIIAVINNLDDKDWTVKPTYALDEEYGKVVSKALKVYKDLKRMSNQYFGDYVGEVKEKMCDDYCKYPRECRNADEIDEVCQSCPMNTV